MTDGNVTLSIPSAYKHPATHPASMITGLATVATSGKYSDLSGKPSLAKVATSGNYNDLSNKPSISTTPNAYVTDTYRSGSSWYRTWSDGFKECGGYVSSSDTTGNASLKFSFPITISTRINVVSQTLDWYDSSYACQYAVTSTTSTSFTIRRSGSDIKKFYYYACGY